MRVWLTNKCLLNFSYFSPAKLEFRGFPGGTAVKSLPANAGDTRDASLTPGLWRSPGVGNGNPLRYSCLENPIERGAQWDIVHGVTKSWTWLSMHAVLPKDLVPSLSFFGYDFYLFKSFSLVTHSCLTLCTPMDCSMPGFPVHHQIPELAQTHVH